MIHTEDDKSMEKAPKIIKITSTNNKVNPEADYFVAGPNTETERVQVLKQ